MTIKEFVSSMLLYLITALLKDTQKDLLRKPVRLQEITGLAEGLVVNDSLG